MSKTRAPEVTGPEVGFISSLLNALCAPPPEEAPMEGGAPPMTPVKAWAMQRTTGNAGVAAMTEPARAAAEAREREQKALTEIRRILALGWVAPWHEAALEHAWTSLGPDLGRVREEHRDLWDQSVARGAELGGLTSDGRVAADVLPSDVLALARAALDHNRDVIVGELVALEGPESAAVTVDLQELALEVASAMDARARVQQVPVWVLPEAVGAPPADLGPPMEPEWMVAPFSPRTVTADPPPDVMNGERVALAWSAVKPMWDAANAAVLALADQSPALYALASKGDIEALRALGQGTTEDAQVRLTEVLEQAVADLNEAELALDEGDLGWQDLGLVQGRALAGQRACGSSGVDWTDADNRAAAQGVMRDATRAEFWENLGLGAVAGVAFLVAELASAGSATFLFAAGLGLGISGGIAAEQWTTANSMQAAVGAGVSLDGELVEQMAADRATTMAVLSTVLAFLDAAGPLTKAANWGARSAGEVGETAVEQAALVEARAAATELAVTGLAKSSKAAKILPEQAENWSEVAALVGKPWDGTAPAGYAVVRTAKGGQTLRRAVADDNKLVKLWIDQDGILRTGSPPRNLLTDGRKARELITAGKGTIPAGVQVHHVIPEEVLREHPLFIAARKRGRPPYDVENPGNLLPMASEEAARQAADEAWNRALQAAPMHRGSHPRYTDVVRRVANTSWDDLRSAYPSEDAILPEALTEAALSVQEAMRSRLLRGDVPLDETGRLR